MSAAATDAERVVIIRVADERFAISAAAVEEVVDGFTLMPLPGLPDHSPGVLCHRGEWLPVVDPAPLLEVPRGGEGAARAALIVRRGRVRFALAVDAVVRVMERPRTVSASALFARRQDARPDDAPLLEDEEGVITPLRPDDLFHGDLPEGAEEGRMSDTQATATPVPIVAFRLAADAFGVDVQQVQEVIPFVEPRPVPHAPDFVEGVIDVRGAIVPVVDLRKRFELPAGRRDADTRVLLVALGAERIGLVVDAVTEVVRVPPEDIAEPPGFFRGLAARYLAGLARVPSGLIILLRLDRILSSEERLALLGTEAETESPPPDGGAAAAAGRKGRRSRRRTG